MPVGHDAVVEEQGAASGEVLVVGDILVDVVVVPEGPIAHGSDTTASVRSIGGGAAANTAAWLAASGHPVRLVAAVGHDLLGPGAIHEVTSAGVTWAGVVDERRPTGTCVVLVDHTGERSMLPDRGANDALDPATIRAAFSQPPAWLHLSGYTLLGAGSRPAGIAALEEARRANVPVSVDASSAAPIREVGAATFLEWVDGAEVLFANDDEVDALGGPEAILRACRCLVAKHGAGGASWSDGGVEVTASGSPVDVVDTVGAGDAFNAGAIAALLGGAAPRAVLEAGNALGARVVGQRGARPWRPPIS